MEKMGLNELAQAIHKNAVDHGWWETDRELPEVLMLCVSELSEALEEYRNGQRDVYFYECDHPTCGSCFGHDANGNPESIIESCHCSYAKPEGVAVEMADCLIRILDYAGRMGWDIEAIVREKHEYNKSRPYRHGGKKC